MFIKIRYESVWRNSFLECSNNEPIPKGGRKFIASTSSISPSNFISRNISKDTVMGVLNRLIGDQQKLYQARKKEDYYFKLIEQHLTEDDIKDYPAIQNEELVYLRMLGTEEKGSFTGEIKINDPIFKSEYSPKFWGVLCLEFNQLCGFVLDGKEVDASFSIDPISILNRLNNIASLKPVESNELLAKTIEFLSAKYPEFSVSYDSTGKVRLRSIYCSALYLQMERLEKQLKITIPKSPKGLISGISKNGHTPKDFLSTYSTGKKKLAYGTPYVLKQKIKGQGEITRLLTKASGLLEITLNISREQALDLQEKIDCAGVSSFYLGKKGLAYVEDIRI